MPFRISNDHIIQKRLENCQFYGGTELAHKRTLKNRFRSNHFYKETDQITLNIVHCNSSLVKCLAFVMVFVCVVCDCKMFHQMSSLDVQSSLHCSFIQMSHKCIFAINRDQYTNLIEANILQTKGMFIASANCIR